MGNTDDDINSKRVLRSYVLSCCRCILLSLDFEVCLRTITEKIVSFIWLVVINFIQQNRDRSFQRTIFRLVFELLCARLTAIDFTSVHTPIYSIYFNTLFRHERYFKMFYCTQII